MGAPESEKDSEDDERPQHKVIVPSFQMGKYPVTQEQCRAVASLPKVEIDLNLDPSRFKGDKLPVNYVSLLDSREFCARISVLSAIRQPKWVEIPRDGKEKLNLSKLSIYLGEQKPYVA